MKEIVLTQGKVAQVDDFLYDYLSQWKWHYSHGYAHRRVTSKGRMISMHRQIMGDPPGMHIDHMNGDGLFNLMSNLRVCTNKENARNARLSKNNTSGYKGVTWDQMTQRWRAQIMVDRKTIILGYFDDRVQAACAHNAAALKNFGAFANLNDIPGTAEEWNAILEESLSKLTRRPNTSGYIGVSWATERSLWECYITLDRHRIHLGRYETREEAAYMRDQAALQLLSDDARLNILDKDYDPANDP